MAKIFIVHQYPEQIEPLLRQLKADGHQVGIHFRGIGVSSAIAKELPDLVVLDVDRAFLDGKALCALLRQDSRLTAVPVVLLSAALSEAELRHKAIEAGAQGGLVGSIAPDEIVVQINQYLRRKRPLLPSNEAQRLQNLQRYRVLDTKPEPLFDDLARVAAIVCETPIALMSLVDETRQWFKASVGLGATETPREQAFCAHAIHQRTLLEVPDATADQRFEHNPLVLKDPKIRFYAGAPLTATDGTAAGTLCVIDRVPRHLRPSQRDALAALGRVAAHLLEERAQRTK